jgi:signal transduction histidine kinase
VIERLTRTDGIADRRHTLRSEDMNERDAGSSTEARALLRAFSDAVVAMTSDLDVETILQRIVDSARRLVGAQYAAIGIPDSEGGFASFITSGIDEERRKAIGYLPRFHGILGAILDQSPVLIADIRADPRFRGWPQAHPEMRSFLGVPVRSSAKTVGAFYLANGGPEQFTHDDEELLRIFATHAAIAIEHARLYELGRELTVIEERNRLARDLHDSVSQNLFSVVLNAESALQQFDGNPEGAKDRLQRVQALSGAAYHQLRSLIADLRPADLPTDGLAVALAKHAQISGRAHGKAISFSATGEPELDADTERELLGIAQEALGNALRHSEAGRIAVELDATSGLVLRVSDDGKGFDSNEVAGRGLGLTTMRERALRIGGRIEILSAEGRGTTVEVRLDG